LKGLCRTAVASGLLAAIALLSCAGGRRGPSTGLPTAEAVGLYRATVVDGEGRAKKFRLLLFAAHPDRLHGEVLSAVGTTEMIVDAGSGRMSVAFTRERLAYVGEAEPEALEKIMGVGLPLAAVVQRLLTGAPGDGDYEVLRTPATGEGLPRALEIGAAGGRLVLKLKRLRPSPSRPANLGTGTPPDGMTVLPLDELEAVELPDS
jgi:hypothetical protein